MARLPKVEVWTRPHPRYGWVMVPILVEDVFTINMALNPGVPRSSISVSTR